MVVTRCVEMSLVYFLLPDVVNVIKSCGSVRMCELVERVHWTQRAEDLFVQLLTNLHSAPYRSRKPAAVCIGAGGTPAGGCSRALSKPLTEAEKRRICEERSERIRQGLITQPGPRKKRTFCATSF